MQSVSKFLISKKDGVITFHKTDLLFKLFSLKHSPRENDFLNERLYAVIKNELIAFGTTTYDETPQITLINALYRIYNFRYIFQFQSLRYYVTPEFLFRGDIKLLKKVAEILSNEYPDIKITELQFKETDLEECINNLIKNEALEWKNVEREQKEIAYINLKKNLKYFDSIVF